MHTILFITRVDRTYFIKKLLDYARMKSVKLIVLSDDDQNSCKLLVDNFIYMPSDINQKEFIKDIILRYSVEGIFVASNFDLLLLKRLDEWLTEKGIVYYGPKHDYIDVCLSKRKHNQLLKQLYLKSPNTYEIDDIIKQHREDIYPLIIKPDYGQGSTNISLVFSLNELTKNYYNRNEFIAQEKIIGQEYTVDCFTDKAGELLLCVPRLRKKVVAGHSVISMVCFDEEIENLVEILNEKLKIFGPWNVQLFRNENGLIVHDINPRIANGIIYSLNAGAPFEKLIVDSLIGVDSGIDLNYKSMINENADLYCYSACTEIINRRDVNI